MQKLVQRTRQAERQVARRIKIKDNKEYRRELRARINESKAAIQDVKRNIQESRGACHEHWKLGPLAPDRRFLSAHAIADSPYRAHGAVQEWVYREFELEQRCKWAGGFKFLNVAPGDRVVILEGPDQGKIDVVKSTHAASGTVVLTECGRLPTKTADFAADMALTTGSSVPDASLGEQAIPISAIRLIHPITDPRTGITRDAIIRELRSVNFRHDRLTKAKEWDRYVPGINVIIPWPEKKDPEDVTYPGDTVREQVQEQTFVPTLLRPPMPDGLINELRNQYSRFRTRHEDWYIEKKEAEEAERKRKVEFAQEMMTPVMEFNRKRRAERKARGEPELSEEMLQKIGEVMARSKGLDMKGIGGNVASLPVDDAGQTRAPPPQ